MKLVQLKGPFTVGQVITVPAQYDYNYVQVGVQTPQNNGHIQYLNTKKLVPDLKINNQSYFINYNDILEFDEISEIEMRITFNKSLPADTIIDIAYKVLDE